RQLLQDHRDDVLVGQLGTLGWRTRDAGRAAVRENDLAAYKLVAVQIGDVSGVVHASPLLLREVSRTLPGGRRLVKVSHVRRASALPHVSREGARGSATMPGCRHWAPPGGASARSPSCLRLPTRAPRAFPARVGSAFASSRDTRMPERRPSAPSLSGNGAGPAASGTCPPGPEGGAARRRMGGSCASRTRRRLGSVRSAGRRPVQTGGEPDGVPARSSGYE